MPDPLDERPLELLNPPALERWLTENVPALGNEPISVRQLSGGSSNAVFAITRGALTAVLRRPPRHPRPGAEKTMMREARVLKALGGTDVPHPKFFGGCNDSTVIGVPFYVMELIDGWMGHGLAQNPPPYDDKKGSAYHALPFPLVDGIARLCKVDYRSVGLDDFGKPENFLRRQVDRWLDQLASYKRTYGYEGRPIQGLEYVSDWLRANTPESRYIGIIHGDYSLGNALFSHSTPPRLLAMIDWELATIGDTMLDLGWTLYGFKGRDETTPTSSFFDATPFPYREDLAEYYAQQSGHEIENLTYYMVLAQFKLAAIMEGHVARAQSGQQAPVALSRAGFVDRLIAKAEEMARATQ